MKEMILVTLAFYQGRCRVIPSELYFKRILVKNEQYRKPVLKYVALNQRLYVMHRYLHPDCNTYEKPYMGTISAGYQEMVSSGITIAGEVREKPYNSNGFNRSGDFDCMVRNNQRWCM